MDVWTSPVKMKINIEKIHVDKTRCQCCSMNCACVKLTLGILTNNMWDRYAFPYFKDKNIGACRNLSKNQNPNPWLFIFKVN